MRRHDARALVLVIDDEPDNLRVVVEHLEAYQFEVLIARDGPTGVHRAQLARPDLILLDVGLPGIDGYETCRRLKTCPETASLPVLFLTALSEPDAKIRGFDCGAVDYVTKPIEVPELMARVRTHLQLHALQADLEARVAEQTAALRRELQEREVFQREREHLLELVRSQSEQLRGLTRQWMDSQRERERGLARTLHERVLQRLGLVHLHLEQIVGLLDSDARPMPVETLRAHADTARQLLEPALREADTLRSSLGEEVLRDELRRNPLLQLSTREYEVLQLLIGGRQTKEIAATLGLARTTVSTYRGRIMEKLEVEDLPALMRFAVRHQVVPWKQEA